MTQDDTLIHPFHEAPARLTPVSLGMSAWWIPECFAADRAAGEAHEAAVRMLGQTLQDRDRNAGDHTDRVTALALRMSRVLGWSPCQTQALRWGAFLHDIGKVAMPDALLFKSGQLAPSERALIHSHVKEGLTLAATLDFLPDTTLESIRDHHERWDGQGYPAGRTRGEISLAGRVIALCDVYDALTSERPYKVAWTPQEALAEITAQAGRQFDPMLTQVFVTLVEQEKPQSQSKWFALC